MMTIPAHKNIKYPPGQIVNRVAEQQKIVHEKAINKEIDDFRLQEAYRKGYDDAIKEMQIKLDKMNLV